MNAKELRIGNYINLNYPITDEGKLTRVGSITPTGVNSLKTDQYLPIELTEKWLCAFGFKFKGMGISGAVYTRHSGHWYKDNEPVFAGSTGRTFDCFFQSHKEVDVKYVHQLQNIYFSITGKELTTDFLPGN